jgi:hypothetical protein
MSSGTHRAASTGRSGRGVDNDTYDPQQWSMRKIAGRDGYESRDGYNPNTNSSGYGSGAYQRPIRRDEYADSESEDEEYDRPRRERGLRKYKSFDTRRYNDDEDDNEGQDSQPKDRGTMMRRSMSRLRTTVKDALGGNEEEDGENNTQTKKWAATVGGAIAGGLAGRRVQKDHWVPAAMGAFLGGFAARELEKTYYRRQDKGREGEEPYEGRRSHSDSRSRSRN